MAKRLQCGYCDYVAQGETDEEVLADIARHNREAHDMEMTEEVRQRVLADIEEE